MHHLDADSLQRLGIGAGVRAVVGQERNAVAQIAEAFHQVRQAQAARILVRFRRVRVHDQDAAFEAVVARAADLGPVVGVDDRRGLALEGLAPALDEFLPVDRLEALDAAGDVGA